MQTFWQKNTGKILANVKNINGGEYLHFGILLPRDSVNGVGNKYYLSPN